LARIEQSIEIEANAERIWHLVRWDMVPKWLDIIKQVDYTSKETDEVGAAAHWIGEAGGVKSEWDTETTEWETNRRGSWRTTGGTFTGIGGVMLTPTDTGTKATFMMDYDLPYSILGKIIDKLRVCKAIEKGTTQGLRKLKRIAETEEKEASK